MTEARARFLASLRSLGVRASVEAYEDGLHLCVNERGRVYLYAQDDGERFDPTDLELALDLPRLLRAAMAEARRRSERGALADLQARVSEEVEPVVRVTGFGSLLVSGFVSNRCGRREFGKGG